MGVSGDIDNHHLCIVVHDVTFKDNVHVLAENSIKFDTVKSGWSIVYIEGSPVIIFKSCSIFSSED